MRARGAASVAGSTKYLTCLDHIAKLDITLAEVQILHLIACTVRTLVENGNIVAASVFVKTGLDNGSVILSGIDGRAYIGT